MLGLRVFPARPKSKAAARDYLRATHALITNRDYPQIADDYTKTFRLLKALPCDIFLGAHGSYYGIEAKFARLQKHPKTNPFVDPEGYHAYVNNRAKDFGEALRKQQ
jgi:metallo-beta-lactamase class B